MQENFPRWRPALRASGTSGAVALPDEPQSGEGEEVVDFVQLATSSDNMDLNLEQVYIAAGSPLDGCSLVAAGLRQRFGVVVVGIRRADGKMDFNPETETAMRGGDDLVVLGRGGSLKELETAAATG